MFENFSFQLQRQSSSPTSDLSGSNTQDSSRSISPFSEDTSFHRSRCSITELSRQFAEQRLRRESQTATYSWANNEPDSAWQPQDNAADLEPRRTNSRSYSPSRRLQRQSNTRLLCTASHHRDIAALVSRMIRSREQCDVSSPESISPPLAEDEDEGYNSSEGDEQTSRRSSIAAPRQRTSYRRSSDARVATTCVSKSMRFRKDRQGS